MSKTPKTCKPAKSARRSAKSGPSKGQSRRRGQRARQFAQAAAKNGTKQAQLIDLLKGAKGASVAEICIGPARPPAPPKSPGMTRPRTDGEFDQEIGALADLSRLALVERWQSLYRTEPPKGLSRRLLVLAIAYRMQAKRFGGLTPAARRRLTGKGNNGAAPDKRKSKTPAKLASGTRLIREWNGITHVVDVADGGFVWNGNRYDSLSAVARAITGARWSGPRFFGLTSRADR